MSGRRSERAARRRDARPPLPLATRPPAATHTFATFVVGESNGRAFTAAKAIATGATTVPLFLHGPSGVGKTHLLHAMCHALAARGFAATALPAASLMDEILTAVRADRLAAFWEALAPLDALLLDDAHSLAGREELQAHLVDALVAWVQGGRRLVLTSDRAPDAMPELAARLRDRFKRALIAHIAPPDPSLRLRLVTAKAGLLGMVVDAALARRLADGVGANVRRLEGALRTLAARATLGGRAADLALALEVLPELRLPALASVQRIVDATARAFGVTPRQLRGRSRLPELALPRRVAMYVARKLLAAPFAALGAEFGRDHSTVLHAYHTVEAQLAGDPALARCVADIERHATRT